MANKKPLPFKRGEREQAEHLLAKATIDVELAKERLQKCKETLARVLLSIRKGGYVNDDQVELPLDDPDDELPGDDVVAPGRGAKRGKGGDAAEANGKGHP